MSVYWHHFSVSLSIQQIAANYKRLNLLPSILFELQEHDLLLIISCEMNNITD